MVSKKYLAIFVLLSSCFALWGLLNNMTDNLVPSFQSIFMTSQSTAGFVQISFYGAYSVVAILASFLIQRKGYRVGVLVGLGVYCLGAALYVPAAVAQSFWTFIVGIFVVAGGCAVLETTCNPYVLALGDESTAVRRLNFAQMFNPVGSFAGIFLAQQLILAHLNPATIEQRQAMDPETLNGIIHGELFWVCVPYLAVCAIAALIWVCFFVMKPTEIDNVRTEKTNFREIFGILVHSPRWYLGVIAQVFYVGVQIAAWTWTNVYCCKELNLTKVMEDGTISYDKAKAANYYIIAFALFMVARWVCTWLMKYFEPAKMMAVFALGAIASSFGVIYLPSEVVFSVAGLPFSWNVVCLCAMSGFMSLMFPTIYGIGLGGIDPKAHKLGAAGLIMAIVGGALLTPWMAAIIDNPGLWGDLVPMFDKTVDTALHASSMSLRASFYVPVICFMVVGLYAMIFSGKTNRK